MDVTVLAPVPQVHALPILSDDETCSGLPWRGMRAILHKLLQPAPMPVHGDIYALRSSISAYCALRVCVIIWKKQSGRHSATAVHCGTHRQTCVLYLWRVQTYVDGLHGKASTMG